MPTSVLDKIEEIQKIDKSDMLSFCVDSPKHYRQAAKISERLSPDSSKIDNIIVAGMGGSAIGGELLKDWTRDKVHFPIEISREYSLPAYAGKRSLALIVSYSGETEESLSAFLDATKKKCATYCVSSGGNLLEFAERLNVPYLRIPSGMPPRAALPYLSVPLLLLMEKMGFASGVLANLTEAISVLEQVSHENSPEKSVRDNFCKNLAIQIGETVPTVYGFGSFRSVALRFKQQFNENSKVPSKWEYFSELDHNEIVGWESPQNLAQYFSAIFLREQVEPDGLRSRIETTKTLMRPSVSKIFEIWTQGNSQLARMLSTVCIGDFLSVYLAILRKVDPTPVRTIDHLKREIGKSGTREKIIRELNKIAEK